MEVIDLYSNILTDNQSGSSGVLRNTVDWLCDSLASGAGPDDVMHGLHEICNRHSAMALLQNLQASLMNRPLSISSVQEWMKTYREHEQKACRFFSERLAECSDVLVYSNSGMLENSILMVRPGLHIYCMESRPGHEGIVLAEKLARAQHRVTILADLAAFSVIPRVDVLAFGCDAITPKGIVNKVGTAALAAAAHTSGKKNYFVGTSEKKLDFWKEEYLNHQGSGGEIYTGLPSIQVENFYFDLTPMEYVDDLFLESGPQHAR
jgi:translation initiation factor 2B subunit (eIF-2B alpha/beta/delta family)